jgi:uncharacterized protein YkwD
MQYLPPLALGSPAAAGVRRGQLAFAFGSLRLSLCFLVTLALASLSVAVQWTVPNGDAARGARSCKGAHSASAKGHRFAGAEMCVHNRERRRHGLRSLRPNAKLARAAHSHARDMVRQHYFGHVSPGGGTVVDRVKHTRYGGGGGFAVGENILFAYKALRTPAQVFAAWMRSASHRANILNPRWRHFGIARVSQEPFARGPGITVVAVFGASR